MPLSRDGLDLGSLVEPQVPAHTENRDIEVASGIIQIGGVKIRSCLKVILNDL